MTAAGRWSRRASAVPPAAWAALGFAVLATVCMWPAPLHPSSSLFGRPGDADHELWFMWARDRHGFPLGLTTYAELGAPFGFRHTGAIALQYAAVGLPALAATRLGAGEVLVYNAVIWSALVLSGVATYAVARRLGARPLAAAWAGLAFTLFPWHLEQARTHLWAAHVELFPVLLWTALRWWEAPGLRRAALVAVVLAVLAHQSSYFLLIGAVALAVVVAVARPRPRAVALLAVCCAVPLLPQLVVGAAQLDELRATEQRPRGELITYGARPWEYVMPPADGPVLGPASRGFVRGHLHGSTIEETQLYLGFSVLALGVGWMVVARRRRDELSGVQRRFAAAAPWLVAAAIVCSLPSPVSVGPLEVEWTPARLAFEVLPFLRVFARFVVLIMVVLALAGSLGLTRLLDRLGGRRALAAGVFALAVTGAELATTSPAATVRRLGTPPLEYADLRGRDPGAIVAEYPWDTADYAPDSFRAAQWQRVHHHPITPIVSFGRARFDLREAAHDLTNPATARALAFAGVRYVLVHRDAYNRPTEGPPPPDRPPGLTLVREFPGGVTLFAVAAEPAAGLVAADGGGWRGLDARGADPADADAGGSRWLGPEPAAIDVQVAAAGRYELSATAHAAAGAVTLELADDGGRTLATAGPVPRSGGSVRFAVDLSAGRTHLWLRASGPEWPLPDRFDAPRVVARVGAWAVQRG